ncbi:ATP-dependent DNA helicase [Heterostelium album PN500]|uniref:DNA helicase n=1 Tax=Heterostelium pallidum (strain ATCC 26659 / Pp 5 / PN500) TaxID=670386 RepID=D3BIG5_HETP5|nr:ATP-dependent DNA helicase [Heterostelium album PN500]EFA79065.1 ATP-dependent DNA helicase [Heterostelium album PN500]|eukprot:XP_020431188.1 ATP-dependent DNA helicase [Heterostelium album PN500]
MTSKSNTVSGTNGVSMSSMSGAQFFNYIDDDDEENEGGWDNLFAAKDNDDDEQQQANAYQYQVMRDCIIFLIDTSKAMFEPDPVTKEKPFDNAIKCLIQTITDKIITSDSDLIGLCLYNTDKNKNLNDFENIYVLFDLDIPDPKTILLLEDILEGDYSSFGGYTENKDMVFCDALWTCSTMFSNCNIKLSHKRIFLFTNQDQPTQDNDNQKVIAIQRAKDLSDLGIEIELFSMNNALSDHPFDFSLFYQEIIILQDDQIVDQDFSSASRFSQLFSKLKRKQFKKRSLGQLPMYIGKDVVIGTQLYSLVSAATRSSPTMLDPASNLPIKTLTKNICMSSGTTLLPSQIAYCMYYGGEPVVFEKREVDSIRSLDRVGLTLLGFKPSKAALKRHRLVKHSNFLFPDEKSITGSTRALNALLDAMLSSDRVAIAKFLPRSNTSPRMVALVPQEEDEDLRMPRGFHIIYLPYADDIRAIQVEQSESTATTNQIDCAKQVIKAYHIDYNPADFLNPALQKHYANLQALALERDSVAPTTDNTKPNKDKQDENQDLVKQWEDSVYSSDYVQQLNQSKKRDRENKNALAKLDWEKLAENGGIVKLTVADLNEFLKNQGQKTPTKAKKADLVEVATAYIKEGKLDKKKLDLLKSDDAETALYNDRDNDEDEKNRPKKKTKSSSSAAATTTTTTTTTTRKKASKAKTTKKTTKKSDEIMDVDDDDDVMFAVNSDDDDNFTMPTKPITRSQSDPLGLGNVKPICKYDGKCYRKNPDHLEQFRHTKQ